MATRALLPLLLACILSACTTGERGTRRPRGIDATPLAPLDAGRRATPPAQAPPPTSARETDGQIPGTPSIRIVWEALYVERERLRTSKWRPSGMQTFGEPDLEVILVNASFAPTPEQDRENRGQVAVGRLARVGDREMIDLLVGLERMGFFEHARPTDGVRPYFASDKARGRITVDRGGESVTLVSYRGLGLQEATRAIPGIYAEAKAAIQVLKNRTPTMSVRNASAAPLRLPTKRAPAPAPSTKTPPAPVPSGSR
jgi:hypothetical protein